MGANPESKASVHVIQDQAVFHLKAQDEWLPENVRQLPLPPYMRNSTPWSSWESYNGKPSVRQPQLLLLRGKLGEEAAFAGEVEDPAEEPAG